MNKPTICVTRDPNQAQAFIDKINALEWSTYLFPTIRIAETENWNRYDGILDDLDRFDWIIFTSVNAFNFFNKRLRKKNIRIKNQKIGAVGNKTARVIENAGIKIGLIPESFSASGIIESLKKRDIKDRLFLIPASNLAMPTLENGLKELGGQVQKIEIYETTLNEDLDVKKLTDQISTGKIDCLTFFSPSSFHFFADLLESDGMELVKSAGLIIAAIGPTTKKAIKEMNHKVDIMPEISNEDALLEELKKYFDTKF